MIRPGCLVYVLHVIDGHVFQEGIGIVLNQADPDTEEIYWKVYYFQEILYINEIYLKEIII